MLFVENFSANFNYLCDLHNEQAGMSKTKKIFLFLRKALLNKYSIVLIVFGVYISFFDSHSLWKRQKAKTEIHKLEQQYLFYLDDIQKNKEMLNRIKHDSVFLEKYAREHYHMRRDGEDVFIFR
jgi:predicted membrane protein